MLVQKIKNMDSTYKSSVINMCVKPISLLISMLYAPLLLSCLGDEKYGLWETLLSIITWINYCDVGIGQGLRNLLAKEVTDEKYEEAKKSVSTAYCVLTVISAMLFSILLILVLLLDWNTLLSTKVDMRPTLLITFAFICVNFILALSNSILYAMQLSERVAIISCAVQALNLAGLLVLRAFSCANMIAVAVLFGCSSLVVYIGNTLQIIRKNRFLAPSLSKFAQDKVKIIGNSGVKFFIMQIAYVFVFTVDNMLITHYFGGAAVTPYHFVNKIFNAAFALFQAFLTPYWSRTTVAVVKHDINWLKRNVRKLYFLCIVFSTGYFLIYVLFKPFARIWIGRDLGYAPGLILVMCLYYIFYTFETASTNIINGTGKVNVQMWTMVLMGITNIPLSIYLAVNCGLGVVGIKLATAILLLIGMMVFIVNLNHIIKNYEEDYKKGKKRVMKKNAKRIYSNQPDIN